MNNEDVEDWIKKSKIKKDDVGNDGIDNFALAMTKVSTPFLDLSSQIEMKAGREVMLELLKGHILGLLLTLTDSNDEAIVICDDVKKEIGNVDKTLNS